jgi:hypothetical protein
VFTLNRSSSHIFVNFTLMLEPAFVLVTIVGRSADRPTNHPPPSNCCRR